MFNAAIRIGWSATAGVASCVLLAAPAAANPLGDYPLSPAQSCSGSVLSADTGAFLPVAGDPTAYQKCGPAGPIGIKHCASGGKFDPATGYCITPNGSATTLTADSVWQEGDACQSGCPPKPIKVKLTYSGTNVGMVSVEVADPTAPESVWGGSASSLTADGQTHSVVITTNKLAPTAPDWVLKPGSTVAVRGYLTDGKANPDNDPTTAVVTLSQTVTAISKPAGTDTSASSKPPSSDTATS